MLGEILAYYAGRHVGQARQQRRRPRRPPTPDDIGLLRAAVVLFVFLGILVIVVQ